MGRRGGSPFRSNGSPIPDAVSLIRSFNMDTNPTRPVRPSPLTASTIPDMPLDLVDRIRSFPLFLSAPDSFLAAIGKHLRPQVHSAHDHILAEGDDAKAMYWLVRGAVAVTSRDGEATYAELKPGAFFGEIGILMDVPRTATIVARTKCLLVVLKKEDLRLELPNFPEMEKAIMQEAQERLTILNKKRKESGRAPKLISTDLPNRGGKVARGAAPGEVLTGEVGKFENGIVVNTRKRKSPSPSTIEDPSHGSALGSGFVNVRRTLQELPLFSSLPPDILHFLGLSAQPITYPPFTDIIVEGSEGSDIYFIVKGEAEVLHASSNGQTICAPKQQPQLRPRLGQGQYFGEVASLALAPRRTATVRSITAVECLMISGEVLGELWRRCSPDLRSQVEQTAKARIGMGDGVDTPMTDVSVGPNALLDDLAIDESSAAAQRNPSLPLLTYISPQSTCQPQTTASVTVTVEPVDPDPFLSVDIDNIRTRAGRRGSFAPPSPDASSDDRLGRQTPSPSSTSTDNESHGLFSFPESNLRKKAKVRRTTIQSNGRLPDNILINIFSFLDIYQLLRLRSVSLHWTKILTMSPQLCLHLDLSTYNRYVTNKVLVDVICPFLNRRPLVVDISNCFHLTDEGFNALASACSPSLRRWRMKSAWDISANAVLEMANRSKKLRSIDLSNCRKVSDNLLARIIGWIVTEPTPAQLARQASKSSSPIPPPGTVVGCSELDSLTLSYCKHVTDRSMAHIAVHAHGRIRQLDLTRCTTITDAGFQHWSLYRFDKLETLILADCTYLTDNAIVHLTNVAKGLKCLDLVGGSVIIPSELVPFARFCAHHHLDVLLCSVGYCH